MLKRSILLPLLGVLASCNPMELEPKNTSSNIINNNDGSYDGMAYIYADSPANLREGNARPGRIDMGDYLASGGPKLITENNQLTGNCALKVFTAPHSLNEPCIHVLSNAKQTQITGRATNKTFIFPVNSKEFYETNTLYHVTRGTNFFLDNLGFAFEHISYMIPSAIPKSIPSYLTDTKLFWFKSVLNQDSRHYRNEFLTTYSQCELDKNASFSPAGPTLCFGHFSEFPGFYFVQDPDIIYHELGHALVAIMMNLRNGRNSTTYHDLRSNLDAFGYNEAGSINEGIADYFAYLVTFDPKKSERRIGEFALGKTANQARPVSEAHPSHISVLSETSQGRLSYPEFLLYDPNYPTKSIEDVHYAGQIMTHYLVALTKKLKSVCTLPADPMEAHNRVSKYTSLLLAETLAELGDLYAKGIDNSFGGPLTNGANFVNLDSDSSYVWLQVNNQVTYRRFSQVFAKKIKNFISPLGYGLCPQFTKDESEKLLDDYGLLLFKTYNDLGHSTKDRNIAFNSVNGNIPTLALTKVQESYRRKSTLTSKELISLAKKDDQNTDRVGFYLIDNKLDIDGILQELLFKGFSVPLSTNVAGTEYNSEDVRISPGEIVGIIPNLQNNSNISVAGVQVLANDWDHVDLSPANAANGYYIERDLTNPLRTTYKEYKRLIPPATEGIAPVCMVQVSDETQTRWASQKELADQMGLNNKDCLGYSASNQSAEDFTYNPHECLLRFLPGANTAFFSRIDPQKTYYESVLKKAETESERKFNVGNILLMEVNKNISPGTRFKCKMRVRFNNCSDCYSDPEANDADYLDYELNGHRPFKVINFEFDINGG